MDQLTSSSRTSDRKNIKTSLELVVSTHSKNMLVKLDHFCKDRGEMVRSTIQLFELPPVPVSSSLLGIQGTLCHLINICLCLLCLCSSCGLFPFFYGVRSGRGACGAKFAACVPRISDQTSLGCLLLIIQHFSKCKPDNFNFFVLKWVLV